MGVVLIKNPSGEVQREHHNSTTARPVHLVVNDRKFSVGTVFFSHTKSASSTSSRSSNEQAQPNEQAVGR